MDQLRSWLKERYQLAVAVYSTPAAEAVLAKSGLTITDFLRPLSLVNKLNGEPAGTQAPYCCSSGIPSELAICAAFAVPMRVGEISYRIQEIKLALYAGNTMFQPKSEAGSNSSSAQLQPIAGTTYGMRATRPQEVLV
jgi:hypothetical protein